jgi:hypothetical protein
VALDLGHVLHQAEQGQGRRWHGRQAELRIAQPIALGGQRGPLEVEPVLQRAALVGTGERR